MNHLLSILGLACLLYLFWQQRRQAEIARQAITRHCDNLNLQIVSISSGRQKLRYPDGRWGWHTRFAFEFSAQGDDCYQGELVMSGLRIAQFYTQPHRM